jgi:hypothetical protein
MAKKKKKDQALYDKALGYLKAAIQDNTTLIDDYKNSLDAYFSKPYGNEVDGRSQIVMSDVSDTIEWIMPAMMKIFYGGSQVVELKPQGPEDELKAKLMEEKINFDFMKGMNGYTLLHDWFKTALFGKYAVVKYWWEEKEIKHQKEYEGLTEFELQALQADEKFETDSIEEEEVSPSTFDSETLTVIPAVLQYNVKGFEIERISKPMAQSLPPEEFIFDIKATDSIKNTDFCAHRKKVHKNYLKKYNVKPTDIEKEIESFDTGDILKDTRFEDLGGLTFLTDKLDSDFVYIYECYLNDYDEEGEPTPMKVTIFGSKVIDMEENTYGAPPFCGLTAIRVPHRAAGRSLTDLVSEIQKLKTALMRAILDNIYYQNNAITVVNPYRINMDDVIDRNEPGAKWRTLYDTDPNTVVAPVPSSPMGAHVYKMMEMVDAIKEKRTGVTSYNQGLDSKSLNKTATGISQIMGAAQQRMELIARMFAETGVRELFQAFVDMNVEFFDGEMAVKLNEEWQQITPDSIDGKYDIIIDVGVGTGSREVQINQLMTMINVSGPAIQLGAVSPENFSNLLRSVYELMGYKNPDKFVTNPKQKEGPDPAMLQQQMQQMQQALQQLQQENMMLKTKQQIEIAKLQLQGQKQAEDNELAWAELDLEEKELALEHVRGNREASIKENQVRQSKGTK